MIWTWILSKLSCYSIKFGSNIWQIHYRRRLFFILLKWNLTKWIMLQIGPEGESVVQGESWRLKSREVKNWLSLRQFLTVRKLLPCLCYLILRFKITTCIIHLYIKNFVFTLASDFRQIMHTRWGFDASSARTRSLSALDGQASKSKRKCTIFVKFSST